MGRNGGCAATPERAVGAGANCRTPQTLWKTMWITLLAPVDNDVDKAAVSWTAHVLGTGQQAHSRDVVPPCPMRRRSCLYLEECELSLNGQELGAPTDQAIPIGTSPSFQVRGAAHGLLSPAGSEA